MMITRKITRYWSILYLIHYKQAESNSERSLHHFNRKYRIAKICATKFNELKFISAILQLLVISPAIRLGKEQLLWQCFSKRTQHYRPSCYLNNKLLCCHDCVVEDFVHISPNAALAGNVQ